MMDSDASGAMDDRFDLYQGNSALDTDGDWSQESLRQRDLGWIGWPEGEIYELEICSIPARRSNTAGWRL